MYSCARPVLIRVESDLRTRGYERPEAMILMEHLSLVYSGVEDGESRRNENAILLRLKRVLRRDRDKGSMVDDANAALQALQD